MTLPLKGRLLPSLLTPAKDSVCKCEVNNSGTKSRSNIIVHTSHTCSVELYVIKLDRTSAGLTPRSEIRFCLHSAPEQDAGKCRS